MAVAAKYCQISFRVCLNASFGNLAEFFNVVDFGEPFAPFTIRFCKTKVAYLATVAMNPQGGCPERRRAFAAPRDHSLYRSLSTERDYLIFLIRFSLKVS